MIPTDYRLETVCAGLAERLDGARRSYTDPQAAAVAFREIADEHVQAVVAEWDGLGWSDDGGRHAAFLRKEVRDTFVPRATRIATAMTASEATGHGLGWLATPAGRAALAAIAFGILWLFLRRYLAMPGIWPVLLADLALPFVPDLVKGLAVRRYRRDLVEAVTDMGRIQTQALAYEAPPQLEEKPRRPRRTGDLA